MKFTLGSFLVFLSLLVGLPTQGATTCETMCSHIYGTGTGDCNLTLDNSSGDSLATQALCVTSCSATDADVVTCLTSVACTSAAVTNCLNTGLNVTIADDAPTETELDAATTTMSDCDACIYQCSNRYASAIGYCCTGCGCNCMYQCLPSVFWGTCD